MLALCGGMASPHKRRRRRSPQRRSNPTTVDVIFGNERMTFDFYGDNIFRLFQDNNGGIIRDPEAKPEAQILVDNPRRKVSKLEVSDKQGCDFDHHAAHRGRDGQGHAPYISQGPQ